MFAVIESCSVFNPNKFFKKKRTNNTNGIAIAAAHRCWYFCGWRRRANTTLHWPSVNLSFVFTWKAGAWKEVDGNEGEKIGTLLFKTPSGVIGGAKQATTTHSYKITSSPVGHEICFLFVPSQLSAHVFCLMRPVARSSRNI